jgi:hypothetical protein
MKECVCVCGGGGKRKLVRVLFNWAPRHEGVLGSGGIAPFSDLGTRWI